MKTKWTVIVGILLAAVLALPTLAEAVELAGTGTVRAVGSGHVGVRGRGWIEYHLHGAGRLIVGNRHDNNIQATGEGTRTVNGDTVVFVGWNGRVTVKGPKLAATFRGGKVRFAGRGHGRVVLKGRGKYWVNGNGPKPWKEDGCTIPMGTPDGTDNQTAAVETTDDAYAAETAEAAATLQTYPSYKEWAEAHPAAAAALLKAKNYYAWAQQHPKAAAWIANHPHWKAWLAKHPKLATFLHNHHAYVAWLKDHPDLAASLKHPYAYRVWLENHPKAAAALTKGVPYAAWAKSHPAAAAALARQRAAIKDKLDLNDDGVVGPAEKKIGFKKRVDADKDGKIEPAELKRARDRKQTWKKKADLNKNGVVGKRERAIDALKRKKRHP